MTEGTCLAAGCTNAPEDGTLCTQHAPERRNAVNKDRTCANEHNPPRPAHARGLCRPCYTDDLEARRAAGATLTRGPERTAERAQVPCAHCGTRVELVGDEARRHREHPQRPVYCSREHQKAGARVHVHCTGCDVLLLRYAAQVKARKTGRFFCDECRGTIGTKPRRGTVRQCANPACGETFYAAMTSKRRWHSMECRRAHNALALIDKACAYCGEGFKVIPGRADQRFCTAAHGQMARTTRGIGRMYNGREVTKDDDGYLWVYLPDHPDASARGRVAEHRLVAEREVVHRRLRLDEDVNHIDEDTTNNDPSNLQVLDTAAHTVITVANAMRRRRAVLAELEEYRRRFGALGEEGTA